MPLKTLVEYVEERGFHWTVDDDGRPGISEVDAYGNPASDALYSMIRASELRLRGYLELPSRNDGVELWFMCPRCGKDRRG